MNIESYNIFLREQAEKSKAKVSVLISNIATNERLVDYKSELQMVSASTIKTPIMLYALKLVQDEKLNLSDEFIIEEADMTGDSMVFEYGKTSCSLLELLTWMIIESDNTATNVLINLLNMDDLNDYFKTSLELKKTVLMRKMLDFEAIKNGKNNYTSALDMEKVFNCIYKKTILTPKLCDIAMDILLKNRDTKLFLRYISDNIKIAKKTGGLDFLAHDTGIVYLPEGDFFYGFFVSDISEDIEASRLIGRLAKGFYESVSKK